MVLSDSLNVIDNGVVEEEDNEKVVQGELLKYRHKTRRYINHCLH